MLVNCCAIFTLFLSSILIISNRFVAISIIFKALNSNYCPPMLHAVHSPIRFNPFPTKTEVTLQQAIM